MHAHTASHSFLVLPVLKRWFARAAVGMALVGMGLSGHGSRWDTSILEAENSVLIVNSIQCGAGYSLVTGTVMESTDGEWFLNTPSLYGRVYPSMIASNLLSCSFLYKRFTQINLLTS